MNRRFEKQNHVELDKNNTSKIYGAQDEIDYYRRRG